MAAGLGERLGAGIPKALVRVAGRPMVAWSVRALAGSADVGPIVVVAPPGSEREIAAAIGTSVRVHAIVPGASSRQRSVAAGIAALPDDVDAILVHDAARPLLTPEIVGRVISRLSVADGVIAAAPLDDTLKRADAAGMVGETIERRGMWGAQTPQVFHAQVLRDVFADATDAELDGATDCAGDGGASWYPGAPRRPVCAQPQGHDPPPTMPSHRRCSGRVGLRRLTRSC